MKPKKPKGGERGDGRKVILPHCGLVQSGSAPPATGNKNRLCSDTSRMSRILTFGGWIQS